MLPTLDGISQSQARLFVDLRHFAPELILVGTILTMLIVRLVRVADRHHLAGLALGGCTAALLTLLGPRLGFWAGFDERTAFAGMLIFDPLADTVRLLLLLFVIGMILFTRETGVPDAADSADFYTLLLGATLGMMLMVSANHLLMVFIAIEMASLPSYAMTAFLKNRRAGSEAALKYVIYGAAAAGVMLYGISLLAGSFGTGQLDALAFGIDNQIRSQCFSPMLIAGIVLFMVGLGFKLAVVPFHFWLPDVFEGASAEVAAFLSVASKIAAFGLILRIVFLLLPGMAEPLSWALIVSAGLTATLGSLAALTQTNLKRLLAYSTLSHAGTMLMAVATLSEAGRAAVLFYMLPYLMMNLGAFIVVAMIRNQTSSETLESSRGLLQRSPMLAVPLAICLASLLGLPPLAGFAAKFQVFSALYSAGLQLRDANPQLGTAYWVLLGLGIVNTVISAAYYLRWLRMAILEESDTEGTMVVPLMIRLLLIVIVIGLIVLGIAWG